ncbi:MAG: hypothetical protein AAFY38_13095 [Pseudomonadota bacterium]
MSYDFDLYTSRTAPLPTPPGAQIRVDGPDRVEGDDLAPEIAKVIGRKRQLFRIHIEGDTRALDPGAFDRWLSDVVAASKGVLIDLQTDSFQSETKSGTLAPGAAPPPSGWMNFHLKDGEGFYAQGLKDALATTFRLLPAAAPTRFGHYEPLRGTVDGGDFAPLIAAYHEDTQLFMKAKAPFGHIFVSTTCAATGARYHPQHYVRRHVTLSGLNFELRPAVFAKPKLMAQVMALFEALCLQLDVVYAEITRADHSGAWFWYGLPKTAPQTCVIGPAYHAIWPELLTGRRIGPDHILLTTDRFGAAPRVPDALIAPEQKPAWDPVEERFLDRRDTPPRYAELYSFDRSFDLNTYRWYASGP